MAAGIAGLSGLAVMFLLLAFPFVSRCLHAGLPRQAAGAAAAPRPASDPGPGGAAPAPEPQPSAAVTGPFGYDNGLIIGEK